MTMTNGNFKESIKADISQHNPNNPDSQINDALSSISFALKVLDEQVKNSEGPTTFDYDAVEKLYECLYAAQGSLKNTTPSIQSDKEAENESAKKSNQATQQNSEGELDVSDFL